MNELSFPMGFYNLGDVKKNLEDITYQSIVRNEGDADLPYDDADLFRQGSCELFALALRDRYGYSMWKVQSTETAGKWHMFCKSSHAGKTVYIDVRGMTLNWREFLSGTQLYKGESYCVTEVILPKDFKASLEDQSTDNLYERSAYEFAEKIIEKYHKFYECPVNLS